MPNIAPPARYDVPWKTAATHAFPPFLDFYFPALGAQIDWRRRPRFRDKELASLGFAMPHWRPRGVSKSALGQVAGFSFTCAKLLDHATDLAALEASDDPIAWVTLAHFYTLHDGHDTKRRYAAKLHLTKLLFRHDWDRRRILALFNVVNWMMVLPEPDQRRYWQAVLRMQKERDMKLLNPLEQMFLDDGIKKGMKQGLQQGMEKGIEKGLARGRKEGLEQGLALGRRDGAVALLERLLTQRFGPLPQTVHKRLAKASLEQMEAWSDALVTAQSLRQVFR